MQDKAVVHEMEGKKRIARGIRMAAELWEFVEAQANALGEDGASQLIERWVSEKRDAVRRVA